MRRGLRPRDDGAGVVPHVREDRCGKGRAEALAVLGRDGGDPRRFRDSLPFVHPGDPAPSPRPPPVPRVRPVPVGVGNAGVEGPRPRRRPGPCEGEEGMRVALAQLAPKLLDKEANLSRIEKTVANVAADLAMFGELFLTGYMARDAFPRLAETVPGPATDRLSKIASEYGTHVLVGMPERDTKG